MIGVEMYSLEDMKEHYLKGMWNGVNIGMCVGVLGTIVMWRLGWLK